MTTRMTGKRFAAIVAAYGTDPERWPAAERAAACAFAAASQAGRDVLAAERALDEALGALSTPAPASAALVAALRRLAVPASHGRSATALERLAAGLRAILTPRALIGEVTALGLAIGVGLWLGANARGAQAETVDLSDYVLGGAIDLLQEGDE